jgi:hypothetical protein
VSCTTTELCLVIGNHSISTSTDPTQAASWKTILVGEFHEFAHSSCASSGLCVVTSNAGQAGPRGGILESTDPTGDELADWSTAELYGAKIGGPYPAPREEIIEPESEEILTGVSCMPHACVVTDRSGDAIVGSEPAPPAPVNETPLESGAPSPGGNNPPSPPTPTTGPPRSQLAIDNAFSLDSIQTVARRGAAKLTLTLPGPGALDLVARAPQASLAATAHARRHGDGAMTIATLRLAVSRSGRIVAMLTPTPLARAALARLGRLRAALTITYTPRGGRPRSLTRTTTFTLRPRPHGN